MKKKSRKILSVFLSMVLMAGLLQGYVPDKKAEANKILGQYGATTRSVGIVSELSATYEHGPVYYHTLAGETAYCIDYAKHAYNYQSMHELKSEMDELPAKKKLRLQLCMAYGHHASISSAPSAVQRNEYIATQAMVWIIMKGVYGNGESAVKSCADKFCNAAPSPDAAKSYFNNLYAKIEKSSGDAAVIPSFTYDTKAKAKNHAYEMTDLQGNGTYKVSLGDDNKVFGQYYNYSVDDARLSLSKAGSRNNRLKAAAVDESLADEVHVITLTNTFGAEIIKKDNLRYFGMEDEDFQRFMLGTPIMEPIECYAAVTLKASPKGRCSIKKVDADNASKVLEGAVFGLYRDAACTDKVEEMKTDEEGSAISSELAPGTYYIKELQSPEGYDLITEIYTVEIVARDTTPVDILIENPSITTPKGNLSVYKNCQVLDGYADGEFTYHYEKASGFSFTLTAAEDIYFDGTMVLEKGMGVGQEAWDGNMAAGKAKPILGRMTDSDGIARFEGLAPGSYYLSESSRMYYVEVTDDGSPSAVEIPAGDTAVRNVYNDIVQVKQSLYKKDIDGKTPVEGAVFELYATEDVSIAGKVVFPKDAVIQREISEEDGYVEFMKLPAVIADKFDIREVSVPEPYLLEPEIVKISGVQPVNTIVARQKYLYLNRMPQAHFRIIKKDSDTGKPVQGAVFALYAAEDIYAADGSIIYAEDAQVVEKVVSDREGLVDFEDILPLGSYYALETRAPKGYERWKEKIPLKAKFIDDKTTVVEVVKEVGNRPVSVEVVKTDITGEHELSGASLAVYDQEGYVMDEWISEAENPHVVKNLLPGSTYILHENMAPIGYANTSDIEFTVEDDSSKKIVMRDEVVMGRILLHKKDAETGDAMKGIVFSIRTSTGTEVETLVTDQKGYAQSGLLPIGVFENGSFKEAYTYILKEEKTGEGYVMDGTEHEFSFKWENGTAPVITKTFSLENRHAMGQVTIHKMDEGDDPLEGVEFEIRDSKGNVLETLATDKDGFAQSGLLPVGKYEDGELKEYYTYYLAETRARDGMVMDDAVREFYFSSDDRTEEVIIKNFDFVNKHDITILVEKSTIHRTQCGDTYKYTIDTCSNLSSCSLYDFTMTDVLPKEVMLQEIHTGIWNSSLKFSVSYRLAGDTEWRSWKKNISTKKDTILKVSPLGLKKGEQIAEFRFSFGTVPSGFAVTKKPVYMVTVKEGLDADTEMLNNISLTGHRYGIRKKSRDKTVTLLFENSIEVEPKKNTRNQTVVPERGVAFTPKTGDSRRQGMTVCIFMASAAGMAFTLSRKRRWRKNAKKSS